MCRSAGGVEKELRAAITTTSRSAALGPKASSPAKEDATVYGSDRGDVVTVKVAVAMPVVWFVLTVLC